MGVVQSNVAIEAILETAGILLIIQSAFRDPTHQRVPLGVSDR
jgi:hypothetical protein